MNNSGKLFAYDELFQKGQLQTESADIFQVAELSIIKGSEIPLHTQYCDEFTYAVSGKATIYSGDTAREMTAGQLHYIKQGQPHRIVADDQHNFRYLCIGFTPNPACDSVALFLRTLGERCHLLVEDEGNLKTLFDLLLNEFSIRDDESNLMIHYYFSQLLIIVHRILSGKSKEKLTKVNRSASNQAVYRALRYIDAEYMKIIGVRQVAEHLCYSEYYLSHVFKEKMDTTMKAYITQKKMLTAAELLKNSTMSISEIADQLHFSSLHAFGSAFKRYYGTGAGNFRRHPGT